MERQVSTDIHTIEGTIRQKIEPSQSVTVPTAVNAPARITIGPTDQETKTITEPLSFWQSFLARFQTRWEKEGMITYRKHLYVLFTMTWFPAACCFVMEVGTGLVYYWSVIGQVDC